MIREVEHCCIVDPEGCARNLQGSLARGLPVCIQQPERNGQLAIVGSGPSVRDHLNELRSWPGEIWAVNGAYDYLLSVGVIPHGLMAVDPLPGLAEYVQNPQPQTTFYVSGLCDPSVFDALDGQDVRLWFPVQDSVKYPPGLWLVSGGTTALTRSPFLAHMLGWRDLTYFGADSSFDKSRYCYTDGMYAEDNKDPINWVTTPNGEGPFATSINLLNQVSQLGAIQPHFKGKMTFRCGGLMDAFLRSPMVTEAEIEAMEDDRANAA